MYSIPIRCSGHCPRRNHKRKRGAHRYAEISGKTHRASILTLFVIVTLVFCLLRLMPVEGYFDKLTKK